MNLQCECENISIEWDRKLGVVNSRKCGCDYCKRHKGEYVSDPDSEFSYRIFDESKHAVVKHGHGTAEFHECTGCGLAFVTCDIDGKYYGIINSVVMGVKNCQLDSESKDYSRESIDERLLRRKERWSKVCRDS